MCVEFLAEEEDGLGVSVWGVEDGARGFAAEVVEGVSGEADEGGVDPYGESGGVGDDYGEDGVLGNGGGDLVDAIGSKHSGVG